jgi:hypothetical protein
LNVRHIVFFFFFLNHFAQAQEKKTDTIPKKADSLWNAVPEMLLHDSTLRIINLNPYFTIHVDSVLNYDLQINRPPEQYYWYIKNGPVGIQIDRNTGILNFKADKSFFKSGKLRYDIPYRVDFGVQNLYIPTEHADTSFTIMFYNTEIIISKVKPTISPIQYLEEGDSIRFRVQCESGTFPIEQITLNANLPLTTYRTIGKCNDEFSWMVPFDFIRDNDTAKQKTLILQMIGADKFMNKDTATITFYIRPGINFPQKNEEFKKVNDEMTRYIQELKLTFYAVSQSIKSNKKTRTAFDITASTTALAGTVLVTASENPNTQDIGKILPAVGLTLVPVKEAVAPNKIQEQNTASQIRAAIKRLEYMQSENNIVSDRDPELLAKTKKLREELKQTRLQLIDLPMVEFDQQLSAEEADKYFNDPKVNKKYKLKVN